MPFFHRLHCFVKPIGCCVIFDPRDPRGFKEVPWRTNRSSDCTESNRSFGDSGTPAEEILPRRDLTQQRKLIASIGMISTVIFCRPYHTFQLSLRNIEEASEVADLHLKVGQHRSVVSRIQARH